MSRGPSKFKQRDLTRALKATTAAGCSVARIVIEPGCIVLEISRGTSALDGTQKNDWDDAR